MGLVAKMVLVIALLVGAASTVNQPNYFKAGVPSKVSCKF